jgi:hypothetical protein
VGLLLQNLKSLHHLAVIFNHREARYYMNTFPAPGKNKYSSNFNSNANVSL